MRAARIFTMVAVLAVTGLAASCSSSSGPDLAGLSALCTINSDCDSPLVCAFERCHDACQSSRDCPSKERCVVSDRPYDVCQLADEKGCAYNSQCPLGEICAVDAECRDQCASDRDCISGQVCRSGACADPAELTNDMLPVAADAGMPGAGTACKYLSDCVPFGLVCIAGECAAECNLSVDCGSGGTCLAHHCISPSVDGGGGGGASADASVDSPADSSSSACHYNSDCTTQNADFVCRAGGTCGFECNASLDCESGRSCVSHRCIAMTNIPDGAPSGYGSECVLSSDCPVASGAPLVCLNGTCAYECNTALDCPLTGCCADHACVDLASCQVDGGSDAGAGGSGDGGVPCVSNDTCDDGKYCNGEERCVLGHCGPAIETPCDSHAACIQDMCDEATHACTHKTIAASDGDGDGHLAIVCGGDDCDDTDATVYQGAPELCDDKDNDCNGLIDDHTRVPYGAVLSAETNVGFVTGGAAVLGTTFGAVLGTSGKSPMPAQMYGQVVPTQSMASLAAAIGGGLNAPVPSVVGIAGMTSSMLALVTTEYDCCPISAHALFFSGTGAMTNDVVLGDFGSAATGGDVQWTGTSFLVGWLSNGPSPSLLSFAASGATLGGTSVPTVNGTGKGSSGVDVLRIAYSDTAIATLYLSDGAHAELTTYSKSLTKLGGPIAIPTDAHDLTGIAIGGKPGGFVVVWDDDSNAFAAQFSDQAQLVGTPEKLPEGIVTAAGTTDGAGAGFLLGYSDGPRFGYSNGKNPFELTAVPLTSGGARPEDVVHASASGNVMALSYFGTVESELRMMKAGCSQ